MTLCGLKQNNLLLPIITGHPELDLDHSIETRKGYLGLPSARFPTTNYPTVAFWGASWLPIGNISLGCISDLGSPVGYMHRLGKGTADSTVVTGL